MEFGQIHIAICTNKYCNVYKYILKFIQIHSQSLPYTALQRHQNNHNFHSRDMLFNHSHQTDKQFHQNNHNHPSDDEPGVGVVAISIKPK